jgi:hypothetical protein
MIAKLTAPQVTIDATAMTMTVGDVAFTLEWRHVVRDRRSGMCWEVRSNLNELIAWRWNLDQAKALVMEAAPLVAELRALAHRERDLRTAIADLGKKQEVAGDEPPF